VKIKNIICRSLWLNATMFLWLCIACMLLISTFFRHNSSKWARDSSLLRLHDHRQNTLSRTPLDEWSARRRDLYLTTHNTHKRHIHAPDGIRAHNSSKRGAAVSALHRAATEIGSLQIINM
jgi:hypothetical protein